MHILLTGGTGLIGRQQVLNFLYFLRIMLLVTL